MFQNIQGTSDLATSFLIIVLIIMSVFLILCLICLVTSKSQADRVLAINMLGSAAIPTILVVSLIAEETFFVDVALIYALISFLAVVILSQVYVGIKREEHKKGSGKGSAAFEEPSKNNPTLNTVKEESHEHK